MGYIKTIEPNSTDSHQTSPGYVLTFLRWSNRDTYNYDTTVKDFGALDLRRPLVVYSDAYQVVVSHSKNSMSPTATMTLKGGDINYSTAVHPGDFVIVNMLNWETHAERVRILAADGKKPINGIKDGFKGIYKVQSVVKHVKVDRPSGLKTVVYTITAAGFTEFNNVIYYNPAIAAQFKQAGVSLYQSQIGDEFASLIKAFPQVQNVMRYLFKLLMGQSYKQNTLKEVQNFGNTHFKLPTMVGNMLNVKNAQYATDIYNYIIGTWKNQSTNQDSSNIDISKGFNPSIVKTEGHENFYETGIPVQGNKEVRLEDWNNKTAWSILGGYLNSTLNEIYTAYRVSPDGQFVMPTVVVRQKPFTSEHFETKFKNDRLVPSTRFLQLPRWKISADLLYEVQTSKNDAFRFNFAQVFTKGLPTSLSNNADLQIAMRNFEFDQGDIERNGLRPLVTESNFNFLETKNDLLARTWTLLVSDWVIDGHLKESGVMVFHGLEEPVSVGDNIEFDNVVYHIESISHSMTIFQDGKKDFTTTMQVSYGMDLRSSKTGPVYANMEHTDAQTNNTEDWENERILPGISDTQNILGRESGEEIEATEQISFTPPTLRKSRKKKR